MNGQQYGFGMAPIVTEGGIADPDRFIFECNCAECQEKYRDWKAKYEEQQKQLRGEV